MRGPVAELDALKERLDAALKGAQGRIAALAQGPRRSEAQGRLQQLVAAIGGAGVIMQNLRGQLAGPADPAPEVATEFHRLRGAAAAWQETRGLLEEEPPGIDRDTSILGLVERLGGQLQAIAWLDSQIAATALNESAASFDSELALVLWPDDYELVRWQPNYLQSKYDHSFLRQTRPTLMVARIDASTPELALRMIDDALAAERDGLAGKAYFDARGLAPDAQASGGGSAQSADEADDAAELDHALVLTANGLRDETTLEAILNDAPQLFAPNECPDAAIYCGWYSLGKYVDAFAFNRGAIALHIASDEAQGLHDPASQRWCKRLIEDGAAATIGAVFDPYLAAYPRPNAFFSLLASGKPLGDCFWQTQPRTSWSMVLLGDPLYRPFKNRSLKKEEAVIR